MKIDKENNNKVPTHNKMSLKEKIKMKSFLINLLTLGILVCTLSVANASIPDTVLKQKMAVVTIYILDKDGVDIASGSGFIFDSKGLIATNYHVISKAIAEKNIFVIVRLEDGTLKYAESILLYDEINDLAVLKVDSDKSHLPKIKFSTGITKQGQDIVVIGSPLGLETTVSTGIISGIREKGLIQITAPISPGSSGGPVLNIRGEVIGITTFLIVGGQNLNFAIPIKYLADLMAETKKQKKRVEIALPKKSTTPESSPRTDLSQLTEDAAEQDLREIVRLKAEVMNNPENVGAHFDLCRAYMRLNFYEVGSQQCEQALQIDATFGAAYVALAQAYRRLGFFEKTRKLIASLMDVIKKNPKNHWPYYYLGQVHYERADYKEAIEAFREAVKIAPGFVEGRLILGLSSLTVGDIDTAVEQYLILKESDPKLAKQLFRKIKLK
ncbi:MAG: tetratricopeptide repeat protein [Nitrospirae bacterium]|nr:MAG: tetratricopeptide repeat protein [Nitrospirota bacterium]